jgi:cutinase
VYAVDYPASGDFDTSTAAGVSDASSHIQSMAANCPNTRLVLGGYSQGAAVIDRTTTAMPPQIADHVAAAALFGAPRSAYAESLSGPHAHVAYVKTGMVNHAATFAASRL